MLNDYNDAVDLINKAEADERETTIVTINFKEAVASRAKEIQYDDQEIAKIINFVDSNVPATAGAVEENKQEAVKESRFSGVSSMIKNVEKEITQQLPKGKKGKQQEQAQGVQQKQSQAPQQPKMQQQVQAPQPSKPAPSPPPLSEAAMTESDVEAAAQEMKNINKAQKAPSKPVAEEKPVKAEDDLVLPKLSIPDQISELESIDAGIDAGAFNSDQLGIIRKEVAGLAKIAGNKEPAANDPQKDLISLRNERLKMAIKKLGETSGQPG